MIKLDHVYFRRESREILSDVLIEMNKGEHWVILGKNGSGKTTILEMLNGYLFPSQGSVEVLGNRYGNCDVREVRKSIGYISQSLLEKLNFSDPVWEVVATGLYGFLRFYQEIPKEAQDQANEMLEQLNLSYVKEQPLGLLSQGERKKVLLARALMTHPEIIIMDEPCAGLDLYEREKLLLELERFKTNGISLIYVTHHVEEIVPLFTNVMLLNDGKIVASGSKKEILTSETIHNTFQIPVQIDWVNERPWIQVV
ncbi:ABC transporter ATP-binding protein [Chengkuizengella axinellae]|uniref:ATP-binding cassette domain-containing protein n=1 Tax=Chengkuizengella axinellae TaxID=3064388 RepID=A0ABT9IXJ3_9BACL|nr:ATP-binding cassette domain-containing protein [Chengkuizengella sp. 2205SS18-9]MDP5274088.1 ATP-binding cassette domain-containing protein [Chengkuizengella sp. 2205SS18-9]